MTTDVDGENNATKEEDKKAESTSNAESSTGNKQENSKGEEGKMGQVFLSLFIVAFT